MNFIHLPMKMEPIVSSETSAIRTQTPGNYPKRNKLQPIFCVLVLIQAVICTTAECSVGCISCGVNV